MLNLLRCLLIGITVLDVAIFPFSCFGGTSHHGQLYVYANYMPEDAEGEYYMYVPGFYGRNCISGEYLVGDVIEEDVILSIIEECIDKSQVESYEILGYAMIDHAENKPITLPYIITEEDILGYYQGLRGAAHIQIQMKIKLIEEDISE